MALFVSRVRSYLVYCTRMGRRSKGRYDKPQQPGCFAAHFCDNNWNIWRRQILELSYSLFVSRSQNAMFVCSDLKGEPTRRS